MLVFTVQKHQFKNAEVSALLLHLFPIFKTILFIFPFFQTCLWESCNCMLFDYFDETRCLEFPCTVIGSNYITKLTKGTYKKEFLQLFFCITNATATTMYALTLLISNDIKDPSVIKFQ